jgi:hypothetical protein
MPERLVRMPMMDIGVERVLVGERRVTMMMEVRLGSVPMESRGPSPSQAFAAAKQLGSLFLD